MNDLIRFTQGASCYGIAKLLKKLYFLISDPKPLIQKWYNAEAFRDWIWPDVETDWVLATKFQRPLRSTI